MIYRDILNYLINTSLQSDETPEGYTRKHSYRVGCNIKTLEKRLANIRRLRRRWEEPPKEEERLLNTISTSKSLFHQAEVLLYDEVCSDIYRLIGGLGTSLTTERSLAICHPSKSRGIARTPDIVLDISLPQETKYYIPANIFFHLFLSPGNRFYKGLPYKIDSHRETDGTFLNVSYALGYTIIHGNPGTRRDIPDTVEYSFNMFPGV